MMTTTKRTEASWSTLSPNPIILYLKPIDEYIVYWRGIGMTYMQAMALTMYCYGCTITPKMQEVLDKEFNLIYQANGFGDVDWASFTGSMTKFISAKLFKTIGEFTHNKTIGEVLELFDKETAVVVGEL